MEEIEELHDIEQKYEVLQQIGDGGQGDLFAGRRRDTDHKVAIKVQKEQGFESKIYFDEAADLLVSEGTLNQELAQVSGIPKLLAIGHFGHRRCIVLEFVEGRLLFDMILSARPLKDVATVASIVSQLCEILDAVHRSELVHRDLKPENVMVEPDGRIRLLDLGFAVRALEETDGGCGTMGYSPPEQLGPSPGGVSAQADIFALGCILLQMTVMQLPYEGTRRGLEEGAPVLSPDRLAAIPAPFAQLALAMVEREIDRRPADVREVFAQLRPHVPALGSPPPRKPLSPDPTEYYRTHPPTL